MSAAPPHLGDPVVLACRGLWTSMDGFDVAACEQLGVGRSDLRALNLLEDGPTTPSAIAERLGLSRPAVTAMLDRLERSELVERIPAPDDKRSRLVQLRPVVWQAFARVYRPLGEAVAAYSAGLSDAERRRLARHLAALAQVYADAAERS